MARLKRKPPRLAEALLEGVFPRMCGLCGAAVGGTRMCRGCHRDLPWIEAHCPLCGTPMTATALAAPCAECQRQPPPFARIYAPLHYAFPIDALVKGLKFRHRLDLAPLLAELVLPWLAARVTRFDGLVPVPLHRFRNAMRGFNQAEELARHFAKETGLPLLHTVRRIRHTKSQSGLSAARRRRNLRRAFAVHGDIGHRPLIVDDVVTTGATCAEVARVLLAAGAERVSVLSVARAASADQPGMNV